MELCSYNNNNKKRSQLPGIFLCTSGTTPKGPGLPSWPVLVSMDLNQGAPASLSSGCVSRVCRKFRCSCPWEHREDVGVGASRELLPGRGAPQGFAPTRLKLQGTGKTTKDLDAEITASGFHLVPGAELLPAQMLPGEIGQDR